MSQVVGRVVLCAGAAIGVSKFSSPARADAAVRPEARQAESTARRKIVQDYPGFVNELHELKKKSLKDEIQELTSEESRLTHELTQRAKWEAITTEGAVRAKILNVQTLVEASDREKDQQLLKEAQDSADKIISEIESTKSQVVEDKIAEQFVVRHEQLEKEFESETAESISQMDAELSARESAHQSEVEAQRKEDFEIANEAVNELQTQVLESEKQLNEAATIYQRKREAHKLCALALEMREGEGVTKEKVTQVQELANSCGALICASLASELVKSIGEIQAIPTDSELRFRFENVAKESRRVAMVPENRVYSAAAYLLAGLLDSLKLPITNGFDDDGAQKTIGRALKKVRKSDLAGAVLELDSLKGLPAAICEDWKNTASARVLVDQTISAAISEAYSILS